MCIIITLVSKTDTWLARLSQQWTWSSVFVTLFSQLLKIFFFFMSATWPWLATPLALDSTKTQSGKWFLYQDPIWVMGSNLSPISLRGVRTPCVPAAVARDILPNVQDAQQLRTGMLRAPAGTETGWRAPVWPVLWSSAMALYHYISYITACPGEVQCWLNKR